MRRALAAAAALVVLGCGAKPAKKAEPPPESSDDLGAGGAMAAAGLLGNALERAKEPGPWDEPKGSKGASKSSPHHAVVELSGAIGELESFSLFSGSSGLELRTVTTRLHELAGDSDVKSILLRVGDLGVSWAVAEELRAALVAAAAGDKPIHCHIESAEDLTVFVLTACDSVTLTPGGQILVAGPAMTPIYLKGLLDKLGVQADFLHIGAYKGAAEPLTRTEPSPEARETLDAILDGSYERLLDGLEQGRKVDRAKARGWIDQAIFTDVEAQAAGLVDGVQTFEVWRDGLVKDEAWLKVAIEEEKTADLEGLMELVGLTPKKKITKPHVALIYAVGDVVDGKGDGILGAREQIASRPLAAALRAAADDDGVKVIVMRVDSPGGSALASEVIWHAVQYAKAKKPVVVSMGDLAASGGYYISCGATRIWAQPDTLTGSIGVVGGKLVLGPALESIGVTAVEMGRGKRAMLYSALRRWTDDERKAVEASMRAVYATFVARVAQGRGKRPEEIEPLAQGRVWTGAAARDRGLVDRLGGLDDALADARLLAQLPADAPVDVYPPEPTLFDFLESWGGGVRAPTGLLAGAIEDVRALLGPEAARVVAATFRTVSYFREDAVRVVLIWPVVR